MVERSPGVLRLIQLGRRWLGKTFIATASRSFGPMGSLDR